MKSLFGRVRPAEYSELAFHHGLRRPITSSFPSGHATAAFCAATLLGGGPAWYTAATAVAATRVYVRLHHGSDVIAGAAFGLGLGLVLRRVVNRHS
jgi:undecaprenyl-diphosphatase